MAAVSSVTSAGVSVSIRCEKMEFLALSSSFRAVPGVVNLSKRRLLQAEEAFDHCVQGWRHSSQICARRPALKSSFLAKLVAFRGLPFAPLKSVSPKKHVAVSPVCMAAASNAEGASLPEYFLNVIFNIMNKKLYNYFPYPYFVSAIHLGVGVAYCCVSWLLGVPKWAPIDGELFKLLLPVSICHALGHVMTNVSSAAVAVSFTHTIKDTVVLMGVLVAVVLVGNSCACLILTVLEPFFNAAASQFILGQQIPVTLWLSLAPIVLGVSMASMTELSFNWKGFISAMTANVAFTYRNIYSKSAMLANNTLERVAPLTHTVSNVLKQVFMIGFSIIVFGNKISTQTGIGTAIAIGGVAIYSYIKAKLEEEKRAKAATS